MTDFQTMIFKTLEENDYLRYFANDYVIRSLPSGTKRLGMVKKGIIYINRNLAGKQLINVVLREIRSKQRQDRRKKQVIKRWNN